MKEIHSDGRIIERSRPIQSREVFQWPEYKAFAKRLGIAEVQTTYIVVRLEMDKVAVLVHEYLGKDEDK